jgi:hypothetical protein
MCRTCGPSAIPFHEVTGTARSRRSTSSPSTSAKFSFSSRLEVQVQEIPPASRLHPVVRPMLVKIRKPPLVPQVAWFVAEARRVSPDAPSP